MSGEGYSKQIGIQGRAGKVQELPLVLMPFLRADHGQFLAGNHGEGAALLTRNFCASHGYHTSLAGYSVWERVSEKLKVMSMPV